MDLPEMHAKHESMELPRQATRKRDKAPEEARPQSPGHAERRLQSLAPAALRQTTTNDKADNNKT